jgi:hypothetical protein
MASAGTLAYFGNCEHRVSATVFHSGRERPYRECSGVPFAKMKETSRLESAGDANVQVERPLHGMASEYSTNRGIENE